MKLVERHIYTALELRDESPLFAFLINVVYMMGLLTIIGDIHSK